MQEIMQFVGRHPILSIAWIALLVAVLVTTFKSLTSKVKVITRGEATRLINKEDAVVVDLRQRDDFRKGHIAGSINLLPSEIKANNVGELEKHKDKPVIVVDGSGMQCQEPANALTKAGFAQVFVLKEGVAGWAGENLPLVRLIVISFWGHSILQPPCNMKFQGKKTGAKLWPMLKSIPKKPARIAIVQKHC